MPAYIVATARITDPARFADYMRGIAGVSDSVVGERVIFSRYPDASAAGDHHHIDLVEHPIAGERRFEERREYPRTGR